MLQTNPPAKRAVNSGPNFDNSAGERSAARTNCRCSRSNESIVFCSSTSVARLPRKELHVVKQQQIDVAVLVAETRQAAAS